MTKSNEFPEKSKAAEASDKELEAVSGGIDIIFNNKSTDIDGIVINNNNFDTSINVDIFDPRIKFNNNSVDMSIKFNNNSVDMSIKQNNTFDKNILHGNSDIKILKNN